MEEGESPEKDTSRSEVSSCEKPQQETLKIKQMEKDESAKDMPVIRISTKVEENSEGRISDTEEEQGDQQMTEVEAESPSVELDLSEKEKAETQSEPDFGHSPTSLSLNSEDVKEIP